MCIKWILFGEELSYSSWDVYIRKCKQIGILPLGQRFILNDMILFPQNSKSSPTYPFTANST